VNLPLKRVGLNLGFQVAVELRVLSNWVRSNSVFTVFGFDNRVTSLQISLCNCMDTGLNHGAPRAKQ